MSLRSAYIPHARVQLDASVGGRTHQSFAKEVDINNILKKYIKTGLMDHVNEHHGDYGNYIGFEDYHSSINQVLDAQEAFASIPSSIRRQFDNDPGEFLKFVQNPENTDEMIKMGLAHGDVTVAETLPLTPAPSDPNAEPPAPEPTATPV